MTDTITTTKNKTYKYIKSLSVKKNRISENVFTVEGIKSVHDAVQSGKKINMIAVSESFYNNESFSYPDGVRIVIIKDAIFGGICDTETPQGILAVVEMFSTDAVQPEEGGLYVYCDNIQDPGNLGTIIRTADAAGVYGVMLSQGCVDLYNPKTVRASMGSFFNIPIKTRVGYDELLSMKQNGFHLYCGALRSDSVKYTSADLSGSAVIIIGNEANGVSDEILDMAEHIIIPIYGSAESLNAAVAGAIMMYEAVRQRDSS